jgi:hypothetical protein
MKFNLNNGRKINLTYGEQLELFYMLKNIHDPFVYCDYKPIFENHKSFYKYDIGIIYNDRTTKK